MMFHSMEVIERASPYPQSAADVRRYVDDMRAALAWCRDEGARFVPLEADARRVRPGGRRAEAWSSATSATTRPPA